MNNLLITSKNHFVHNTLDNIEYRIYFSLKESTVLTILSLLI